MGKWSMTSGVFQDALHGAAVKKRLVEEEYFINYMIIKLPNAALVLQDWLYFGIILEILGDVLQDFIVDRPSGRMITTRHLPKQPCSMAQPSLSDDLSRDSEGCFQSQVLSFHFALFA
jgi:hypothetical protein